MCRLLSLAKRLPIESNVSFLAGSVAPADKLPKAYFFSYVANKFDYGAARSHFHPEAPRDSQKQILGAVIVDLESGRTVRMQDANTSIRQTRRFK